MLRKVYQALRGKLVREPADLGPGGYMEQLMHEVQRDTDAICGISPAARARRDQLDAKERELRDMERALELKQRELQLQEQGAKLTAGESS